MSKFIVSDNSGSSVAFEADLSDSDALEVGVEMLRDAITTENCTITRE